MSQRGFTLIEIMIVLAIIAGLITVAAPRLLKTGTNIKPAAHRIVVMGKEIRNKARITNSTYRLAFDLNDKANHYWVERANGSQRVDPSQMDKDKDKPAPSPFQKDKSILKTEKDLPAGFRFGSVETANSNGPLTTGIAYVHFFPEGLVESAAIQITDGNKLTWTLVFNPLTGQADIIEKAQSLKDLQR